MPSGAIPRPIMIKCINTIWEELTEDGLPARPPSAPSNIETISLWGPRYPGQKLYPDTPPIEEYLPRATYKLELPVEPYQLPVEPDHPEIWSRIVTLCDLLRGLIERLPDPVEEPTIPRSNPNGPITSHQLLTTGDSFIQALEPVRPLLPNKLTEHALEKNPGFKKHVHELELKFDDIERVLRCIPQVYEDVTNTECDTAMIEVEAIMVCLGIGLGAE